MPFGRLLPRPVRSAVMSCYDSWFLAPQVWALRNTLLPMVHRRLGIADRWASDLSPEALIAARGAAANSLTAARIVSAKEIELLHRKHVLPLDTPQYLNKYQPLPMHLNTGWRWEDHDFGRVIALLEFREWAEKYQGFNVEKALFFGAKTDPEPAYVRAAHADYVDYDMATEAFDLHTLNLITKDYGFIMANQTLEHLYNPYLCVQNVYSHLAPGGLFYFNVPIVNIPHSTPYHFSTGFTPMGLIAMCYSLGFEILEFGLWGNREYLDFIFTHHSWPDYRKLKSHANEFRNAVQAWALVRRK